MRWGYCDVADIASILMRCPHGAYREGGKSKDCILRTIANVLVNLGIWEMQDMPMKRQKKNSSTPA